MEKKLYKDQTNKMLCGICSGMAKYFDLDVTVMRLIWVLFGMFTGGAGILAYIICLFVVPDEPTDTAEAEQKETTENA